MTNDTRTSAEIERDIVAKRAVLAASIAQFKASLTLGSVAQQVGQVGLQHAGDLSASAFRQAKKNPLPLATIGAGVAWLIYANVKGPDARKSQVAANEPLVQASPPLLEGTDPDDDAQDPPTNVMRGFFDRHPFVVGALAVAVGAAFASILPRSKVEDDFVTSAQDVMRAEKDKLAHIARMLKEEAEAIITETKRDLDSGAPDDQTAVDAVGDLAKGAADRMLSVAVAAAKDAKPDGS